MSTRSHIVYGETAKWPWSGDEITNLEVWRDGNQPGWLFIEANVNDNEKGWTENAIALPPAVVSKVVSEVRRLQEENQWWKELK